MEFYSTNTLMNKYLIVNKTTNKKVAEILLYGYISEFEINANDFVKELRNLEKEHSTINIRINSGGGSVFEGIAIYNAILASKANVYTYIDGLAGSMASIIALAGKRVYINKYATYMTHKPHVHTSGNADSIKRSAQLLESLEKIMISIYSSKTGKSEEECRELFLNGKDNWFNAEEAIAHGLADEIYEAERIKAPVRASSEKEVCMEYAAMLTNYSLNNNTQMKQIVLSAEALSKLTGIDHGEINEDKAMQAINALVETAAKVSQLEAALYESEAAKAALEQEYNAYKMQQQNAQVEALLSDALSCGKITKESANIFKAQYAGNPDGLKAVLDTLPVYQPIVDTLNANTSEEVKRLLAKSWDELFMTNGFDRLKELDPSAFEQKYKEYIDKK